MEAIVTLLALVSFAAWGMLIPRMLRRQPLIEFRPRESVPWTGWDVLLLVVVSLLGDLLVAGGLVDRPEGGEPRISITLLVTLGVSHLVWLALAIVYLVKKAAALADDLGFEMSHLGSDIAAGLKCFVVAVLPVYALQAALLKLWPPDDPPMHPLVSLAREDGSIGVFVLAAWVAVFVAPLYEEFVFRVLIQGWLERQETRLRTELGREHERPASWPIVAVAAMFGLMHWGHGPDPVPLFVLGLFLGYAYRQTHRIYASLVTHMAINSLAMLGLLTELSPK